LAYAQNALPQFEAGECPFTVPDGAPVECGALIVPENRTDNSGEVRLAVAIFRSTSAAPASDPVIFLQGGPGGGIVEQMGLLYPSFVAPIVAERDFIAFDQRGTGLSEPSLDCPQVTTLIFDTLREDYTIEESSSLYVDALAACQQSLTEAGIDLTAYTSAASAADIADLAAFFGYDQINLYGGSYGTRLALTVMRDFPALVRSAVLDGVLSPAENQIEIMASKSDYALNAFFEGCAADAACAAAYPDLEATFYETVERLNAEPAPIIVTIPTTGETIETTVDGVEYITAIFVGLQQTPLIPTVPATIQAVSEGDLTPLQTFIILPVLLGDSINIGMLLSVVCAEEIPATSAEALDAAAAAFPQLEGFARSVYYGSGQAIVDICADWGAAAYDPRESEPVVSDTPTLLLSGEYDPATPPYFADRAAETLSNSFVYVVPGAGHVASLGGGCALDIVTAFLNDPMAEPDAFCLTGITPTFQTPQTELLLVPVENATFGFTSVIPEGWTEIVPNSGTYGESMASSVVLLQQVAPVSLDQLLPVLTTQFGLEAAPEALEAIEGAQGLSWSIYQVSVQGQPADLALAERDGSSYLVLLISTPAQRDLYYNSLFLPVLDAFTPAAAQ
jgi:pimeloyl-ACP methyl ester carboxylesterase